MSSTSTPAPLSERSRVIISAIRPIVDGGRYAIKRVIGEPLTVEADAFCDGHETISLMLHYRHTSEAEFTQVTMQARPNDLWVASFIPRALGEYEFFVEGWVNRFETWLKGLRKKADAGQDVDVELRIGAALVRETAALVTNADAATLAQSAEALEKGGSLPARMEAALDEKLARLMAHHDPRRFKTRSMWTGRLTVERERARTGAWYEFFPRSTGPDGKHGTFTDAARFLDYVASMHFDVVYLPPIHPIGQQVRKGPNNSLTAGPDDVGSPWAIGGKEGGHKAIHPALGTEEDFAAFIKRARELNLEVAMDIAFQCSPDHPYVREHPEWFLHRPDGTIQYAENPPKKYQDIYPFDFECEAWRALWEELKSVVLYWVERGVKIFRVDNPHTKPFGFWEWCIREVKAEHPDTIFLSEAFTRPKPLTDLAKKGFSQSYNYFPWRNTKHELTTYLTELTQTEVKDYLRPNLWPNTPDILPEFLQVSGRPGFMLRFVLAATLGASYGIYGPAYELCVGEPKAAGGEEYNHSEKYALKHWDINAPHSLRHYIARVNIIRRENPALQSNTTLRFHPVDNDQLLCFSKQSADHSNLVVVVVNLDPYRTQAGWLDLPLAELGLSEHESFQVHDLLGDARYFWQGARNYVELNPHVSPAHIFRIRRKVRTERDFDYFL